MRIIGTGSALPRKIVTNDMLTGFLDTSDEWILPRTGIRSRHVISDENLEDLGAEAVRKALEMSGLKASEIDMFIVSNVVSEYITPGMSCIVAEKLGMTCPMFDINCACPGFVYALDMAETYYKAGKVKNVVIACIEEPSRMASWKDRATCVLFGDGAGAVLVEATEEEGVGYQDSFLRTDGKGLPFLHLKAGGSVCPPSHFTVDHRLHYLYQEGRAVFRFAVTAMSNDVMEIMRRNSLGADDVQWVIPHEANMRIIEAVARRAELPLDKVVINIDRYGNTSAATIPLALWDHEKNLKKGDQIVFTAFGAGFVHGASLYKWAY